MVTMAKKVTSDHDREGQWLYVCRMLLTCGAGHQSLGPELSPLLEGMKTLAVQVGLAGVAVALPFPGLRERSGRTLHQRQCFEEGAQHRGGAGRLVGVTGSGVSINVAFDAGFTHQIALPNYTGGPKHFALMVWRNPAVG